MNLGAARRSVLKSAVGAARFRLTGHRAPLAVTLSVTRRCDSSCGGCASPLLPKAELEGEELLALVDHLASLGTTRLVLTGGEPLLRPELGAIVSRAAEHGMWTVLETNGHALPERVVELAGLSRIMIPLHGRPEVHDVVAEPGAWAKATAGIAAARAAGHRVGTVTLLTKRTLGEVPWVVDYAEQHGLGATFQIVQGAGALASKGARRMVPPPDGLREALRWLLEARLAGRPVAMSEKSLRYLLSWEDYAIPATCIPHEDLQCMAGQVSCAIDADGSVHPCAPRMEAHSGRNVRTHGFDAAFAALRDQPCRACVDTACTESNFLYNLNTPVVIEVARVGARTVLGGAA